MTVTKGIHVLLQFRKREKKWLVDVIKNSGILHLFVAANH
jgi:hypothetical protein